MALTQISTDGVKNDAVTAGKIPANAVGTSEISDNAVTQAQIAGESVDEAKMNISNAGSNGQFLQKQSGNTGGLTWATPADNVVGGATGVDFNDTVKTRWGTDNDLEIFHDGSNGVIRDAGDGDLYFQSDGTFFFRKVTSAEDMAKFIQDGAVELYYDNSKKLETFSWGIQNYGNVAFRDSDKATFGGAEDLKIYHDGSNTYLQNATNTLYIKGDALRIRSYSVNEMQISADVNGTVALAYDGVQKFETLSNGVKVTGNIELLESGSDVRIKNDGGKLVCGAGDDLQIYHDGSHSWIENINASQNLIIESQATTGIRGSVVHLTNVAGSHTLLEATAGGAVDLYHNNSKKLWTTSGGIEVTGRVKLSDAVYFVDHTSSTTGMALFGSDNDMKMYHNGSHGFITNITGQIHLRGSSTVHLSDDAGYDHLKATKDGSVELYYDGGKKFSTNSGGVNITGHCYFPDNNGVYFGTGETGDLRIYHDGSVGIIDAASGNLEIRHGAEKMIACANDGQVELYHDNTKKFETTSGGANIHGALSTTGHISPTANNTYDLGDSTYRWRNLYINDLQLSNEGSSNSVDGTWGDWTLQEGENDIFMLNNRTGKKYKMALTEVS